MNNLPIYYYSKPNSTQAIDFMVQAGSEVLPIEVKAEENVKAKSLAAFITHDFASYQLKGIRFSMLGFQDQDWMEKAFHQPQITLFSSTFCETPHF